ncbi:MAG: hypothetical protein AAGD13_13640 [Pseudomonadota bacterium]
MTTAETLPQLPTGTPTHALGGMRPFPRPTMPDPKDRLPLGVSGLTVSPFCIGISTPDTILAAHEMGVNFFFVSADLHWPLYEGIREGLRQLFKKKGTRDECVVAVVSYLEMPLFGALQFHEVIDVVPGMERADVLVAGALPGDQALYGRYNAIAPARANGHNGARAVGGSFHDRRAALLSANANLLDIQYIRYNTAHPGATTEIFPYLRPDRAGLIYNFKSTMSRATPEQMDQMGLSDQYWRPEVTDYYRYVLTPPSMDGVLCSPQTPKELEEIVEAMKKGPLTPHEEEYMRWLSTSVNATYF